MMMMMMLIQWGEDRGGSIRDDAHRRHAAEGSDAHGGAAADGGDGCGDLGVGDDDATARKSHHRKRRRGGRRRGFVRCRPQAMSVGPMLLLLKILLRL